ncbi:ATP-binding protein [Actinoplanes subtropicus]|uniref:ATP-binding protein n=1 Tax=Actinoplanes subtropicus TaxID=543632 RepID=UPI0004C41268|nr:BTAD domain-containing putative transcriptional regulator [Actinoplanes subtropicus]
MVRLRLVGAVSWDGVEVRGGRVGALLAALAEELHGGRSAARLVEALWGDEPPEHPAKALQTVVSRARAQLGGDIIVSTATGYRLALDDEQVDLLAVRRRAEACRRAARAGEHAEALAQAEAGLSLIGTHEAAAKDELRRGRALALSRLGLAAEAIGPLTELYNGRDEELLAELLRSEAVVAGTAAALERYEGYRRGLRRELGSDPGPGLQEVQRELLAGDAPVVRNGLRHEPNELLGRAGDVAAVLELLRAHRVVSVVGTGGLGKTRLAHAVGREAPQRVVHFVELAGVPAGGDVLGEVASAVGVADAPGPAGILATLDQGAALVVLDNCEHVVDQVAALVREVVARTGKVRLLITSRSPLGLSSEAVHPLPRLDLATMVALFEQRARAARPSAGLPEQSVRELCASLEGLPLAAELAAARVRVLSVDEITRRLDDRFALLRGGGRDAPERHRTLHAVIDWSWHLLEPRAQAAMRTLSVFSGGFTIAAATFLTGDDAVVEQLVDQSLVEVVEGVAGTRFRMLETVREFGRARRADAGETDDRFLAWVRDFWARLPEADQDLDFVRVVNTIRAEQDNFAQALRSALDRADHPTVAAASALLGTLWITDSNLVRLAALAREVPEALSRVRPAGDRDLTEAVRTAAVWSAVIAYLMREPQPLRALATLRRLPPPEPSTMVGAVQIALCAPDVAALSELCDSEWPLVAGVAGFAHSHLLEILNDLPGAMTAARRMLARLEDGGTLWLRALAHARIGELCLQADPGREAYLHLTAALSIMEQLGAWPSAARARWAIVVANLQRGAFEEAEQGLDRLAGGNTLEEAWRPTFDTCARAEILLGRGDIDAGLSLWRWAADNVQGAEDAHWARDVSAVAVIAHARHGRLDLIAEHAGALPSVLAARLPAASAVELPSCGTLLLAIALSTADAAAKARMIALADRFGLRLEFQPTMSPAWARKIAEEAHPSAYAEAVSAYAGMGLEELRTAASAYLLGSRANSARAHR